jgi:hypothetical protein
VVSVWVAVDAVKKGGDAEGLNVGCAAVTVPAPFQLGMRHCSGGESGLRRSIERDVTSLRATVFDTSCQLGVGWTVVSCMERLLRNVSGGRADKWG